MRTLVAIVVRLLRRLKSLLAMTILGSLSTAKEIHQITFIYQQRAFKCY